MFYSHLVRHLHVLNKDLLIHPLRIPLIERVCTYEHLVHDDANGPPINWEGVPNFLDLLRSKVGWRSDSFVDQLIMSQHLCRAKVSNLEIAFLI